MESPVLHTMYYDWLQEFLLFLREKHFSISPDTHIRLILVLENNADRITGENILDYISPVVVKNAAQAQALRQAYAEFLEKQFPSVPISGEHAAKPGDHEKERFKLNKWYLLLLIPLAIAVWYIFFHPYKPVTVRAHFSLPDATSLNEPVLFDASDGLEQLSDTAYVRFIWNFGDGAGDSSGYHPQHVYKKSGTYTASLKLLPLSQQVSVIKADTTTQLVVCLPSVFIKTAVEEPETGQSVEFSLEYDSLYPPSKRNTWFINDTPVLKKAFTLSHTFFSPGVQQIRFVEDGDPAGDCIRTAFRLITVKDPNKLILNISSNKTLPAAPTVSLRAPRILLLLLGILLPLLLLAWLQWKLKSKEQLSAVKAQRILKQLGGQGEPAEIPFRNHDELIQDEKELLDVARRYRQRNADGSSYLNISQTIASTIRSEGFLQPVWSSKTKPVEYLVLIDKNKVKNQQVKLFEYLLKKLSRNEVYLEKFYFLFDPDVCTNAAFPAGIPLPRLHDLYPNHIVILLGTGYQFIDSHYPSLREPLVQLFRKWEHWAICTPVSQADWDYREEILQKATFLFPADLKGQLLLFQVLRGEAHYGEELSRLDAYRTRQVHGEDAAELEQYLNDPFLFQWLCALAVYPRIQWDVLVSTGKALQAAHYPEKEVSYSSLLKLVRISWMQEGSFPDHTRLELLKRLQPRNEKLARETMIRLLDEAARKIDANSFAYEELQMQRITDQFLLYAHDPGREEYQSYKSAHNQFKTLWEQGLIGDSPLSAYLRKGEGKEEWNTLIGNKTLSGQPGAGKPMDAFFKESVQLKRKRTTKATIALGCISLLSALLLTAGLLTAKYISHSRLDQFLRLTQTGSRPPIRFRLDVNDCLDLARMRKDSTRFVFALPGNRVRELNARDTAFSFNTGLLSGSDSMVRMALRSRDAAYNLDTSFSISGREMAFGMEGCPVPVPSCGRWIRDTTPSNSVGESYSLFDISIKTGTQPSYRPIVLTENGGRGFLDGKESLEEYDCEENSDIRKIILRNPDGTYQVVYASTKELKDASSGIYVSIAFGNKSFANLRDARNDTSKPLFERKILFPNVNDLSRSAGIRVLSPYQGIWMRGKDSLLINPDANQLVYMKRVWSVKELKVKKDYNLAFYTAQLNDVQRPADRRYLFFCIVNRSRILVNEKMFTQADMQSQALLAGTLNTFTRSGSLQPVVPRDTTQTAWKETRLPAYVQEIWQAEKSDNLLRIDLDAGKLYSTTRDKGDYDGCTILRTYARTDGTYKMICQQGSRYYQFYWKNFSGQSFEFSACQDEYKSAREALQADQRTCDQFARLHLYYKTDPQKIFLPVDNKTYAASELAKINTYLETMNQPGSQATADIHVYTNAYYGNVNGQTNSAGGTALSPIAENSPLGKLPRATWTLSNAPTPVPNSDPSPLFDRDYIIVTIKQPGTDNYSNQAQQTRPVVPKVVFRILWADDHPENNRSLIDQITNDSVTITTAQSNAEALRVLASQSVNLVISDIGRDKEGTKAGLALFDSVRNINRNMPFIFCTSSEQKKESADMAIKSGARLVTSDASELLNFLQKNYGLRINRPKSAK